MARKFNRLNASDVAKLTKHGRHSDGQNLYLSIGKDGGRRWVFLYRWRDKPTELGFGSARLTKPLASERAIEAREQLDRARGRATDARALLAKGINPKGARRPLAGSTFGEVADRVIEAMRPSWRNEKHAEQWVTTLGNYAVTMRRLPVVDITVDDVLEVLRPIWQAKPETDSRLRGRIERVLDAAKAQGLRSGENPARWRGHLDQLLPKRQQISRGHHAAMPYADVPGFMVDLRAREAVGAIALEFNIITAARSGETLRARWSEIDIERGIWTVPPERMKGGREHRVPLSARALEIVRAMHEVRDSEWVFPGQSKNRPLSAAAFDAVLSAMKIEDATTHGFRSSFRDWAAECTNFPNEVCEKALAHAVANKAEAAYRRGDMLDKRRLLMESWSTFCSTPTSGKVVQFSGNRATG
jgi:integrase